MLTDSLDPVHHLFHTQYTHLHNGEETHAQKQSHGPTHIREQGEGPIGLKLMPQFHIVGGEVEVQVPDIQVLIAGGDLFVVDAVRVARTSGQTR